MNELSLFSNLFGNNFDPFYVPSFSQKRSFALPKVDVKETKEAYTLDMDLPGFSENDVELNLKDSVLTISSKKETNAEPSQKEEASAKEAEKWLIKERSCVQFERRFTLPEDVDGENIAATFKNGVLTVKMPRSKPVNQTKKIAINVA